MIGEITRDEALAGIFRALGDPTRLRIFQLLRSCCDEVEIDPEGCCRPAGSLCVGEVCCRFSQSLSTLSRHLKELRMAGLIRMERRGRWIFSSVDPEGLARIEAFIGRPAGRTPARREAMHAAGAVRVRP